MIFEGTPVKEITFGLGGETFSWKDGEFFISFKGGRETLDLVLKGKYLLRDEGMDACALTRMKPDQTTAEGIVVTLHHVMGNGVRPLVMPENLKSWYKKNSTPEEPYYCDFMEENFGPGLKQEEIEEFLRNQSP